MPNGGEKEAKRRPNSIDAPISSIKTRRNALSRTPKGRKEAPIIEKRSGGFALDKVPLPALVAAPVHQACVALFFEFRYNRLRAAAGFAIED